MYNNLNTTPGSASESQANFIADLIDSRNLFADLRIFESVNAMDDEEFAAYKERMKRWAREEASKDQASRFIDRLKALPFNAEQKLARDLPMVERDVPAGRYAVEGDDGTTDFYKVDRPTEGRWAGYVFVKLLIASGGHGVESLSEQRLNREASATILRRIEHAGVRECMERFGRAIGSCGHCGRVLTNEESRERGIGPVCARHMGW
jgi:hypothetical protein